MNVPGYFVFIADFWKLILLAYKTLAS